MRKLFLTLIFILPLILFSQDNNLTNLPINGEISEIGVSPSENLWLATKGGNTYFTNKIGELWGFGPLGTKGSSFMELGRSFEHINFFSEKVLMISGYINGKNSKTDFIYRSEDGGINWEKVKFGIESWIDAAYINENGKAWMSGSSQYIYYTEDSGKTWKQFDKIEKKGFLRFSTIHFSKGEEVGLFGSFWNKIYKTTDNCETWERVSTPLDQKKYERLSKKDRPDIKKIRTFGNYYIINQQGRIFYTRINHIDWIELPNIADFEITSNESVYLIDDELKVELRNSEFSSIWKSNKQLNNLPTAITTKNNSLFAFTGKRIYKINPKNFIISKLMTNEFSHSKVNFKFYDTCNDSVVRLDYFIQSMPFADNQFYMIDNDSIIDIKSGKYIVDVFKKENELDYKIFSFTQEFMKNRTYNDTIELPKLLKKYKSTGQYADIYFGYFKCNEICNGYLTDYYKNGIIRLEGSFENGVPKNEIKIYDTKGKLIEIMIHDDKGNLIESKYPE